MWDGNEVRDDIIAGRSTDERQYSENDWPQHVMSSCP